MVMFIISIYLCQEGYVMSVVCLSVCLSVSLCAGLM